MCQKVKCQNVKMFTSQRDFQECLVAFGWNGLVRLG